MYSAINTQCKGLIADDAHVIRYWPLFKFVHSCTLAAFKISSVMPMKIVVIYIVVCLNTVICFKTTVWDRHESIKG